MKCIPKSIQVFYPKYMRHEKIKLLYHEDGRLLWSRYFPDVPPVEISANKDAILMANFERKMKEAIRKAVPVSNKDRALGLIVWSGERIERDRIYELECDFEIKSGSENYSITILS